MCQVDDNRKCIGRSLWWPSTPTHTDQELNIEAAAAGAAALTESVANYEVPTEMWQHVSIQSERYSAKSGLVEETPEEVHDVRGQ